MKRILLTSVLATCAAFANQTANAAALQICVAEDGGAFGCSPTSSSGALTFTPTLVNFANLAISASGVPIEDSPDLATTDLTADAPAGFTGTHTLEIKVLQTGLAPVNANLRSTFTVNGLISTGSGFPGPSTLSDYTGGSGTGLGNLLHSSSFGTVAIGADAQGPTSLAGITADAQDFLVTFTLAGQSVTDTIQTIGVATPEPGALALLGTGLVGLAALGSATRRKRLPPG